MNVKTEARNEISSPETMGSTYGEFKASQVSGIDSNVQGRQQSGGHRLGLWVAVVALASSVGLATAVAIGAFDSSSDADEVTPILTTELVDPALDRDFHREPGQASPKDAVQPEWDRDFHREPGQSASDDEVKPYGSGLPHEAH